MTTNYQTPLRGVPQHPLRRNVPEAVLGGVCAGVACRLGVSARSIRILTAVASLVFGVGALAYVLAWVALRRDGEGESIIRRIERQRRASTSVLWSLVVTLVVVIILWRLSLTGYGPYPWTILLSVVGVVAIWRGASGAERGHLDSVLQATPVVGRASARGWRAVVWRVIPALVLIALGLHILSRVGGIWGAAVPALVGGVVLVVGVLVMLAPWWLANLRDLSAERRERIRVEERAALVAHVHDSVLQTLTLIERSAGNASEVTRLARAQERELRDWLFAPELIGVVDRSRGSFAEQLRQVQSDVEHDYGVRVELVVVGDAPGDQRVSDLVAAAREATVNAAKWSKTDTVSVYGEVEAHLVSVFVRDTGVGFNPDDVAVERHGLRHSVQERVEHLGGTFALRTAPAQGTEVALTLPRQVVSP